MSYRTKAILFSYFCLFVTTAVAAQESAEKSQSFEQNGVKVEMSITSPDGKPVTEQNSPVRIIQKPRDSGQPNEVEFRFESPDGRNLFASASDGTNEEPTTMRQIRMGDYATDGVLLAGDMWRSMEKWGVAGMLGSIKLATFEKGQAVASFSKSYRLDENELRLLNPLVEFEKIQSDTPVCVSSTHRVMPGENLEFLANLYQTNVQTLTMLNKLSAEDSLDWRLIKVPAVTEKSRSGFSFYTVKYAPTNRKASFNKQNYIKRQHRVVVGQDLSLIAKMHGTTVGNLRQLNGLVDNQKVLAGQVLTILSEVKLEPDINTSHLVNDLEAGLRVQLEDVLTLNNLQSPADFEGGETILIPVADQN